MDGGGEIWEAISRWLTPTILFCLLNLMVATIFISTFKNKNNNQEQRNRHVCEESDSVQFFRIPSFLDRVKSINFSRTYVGETEREPRQDEKIDDAQDEQEADEGHVARTMSDTIAETVVKRQVRGGVKMMKKSESAKIARVDEMEQVKAVDQQRPATVRERSGNVNGTVPFCEDESVDSKADNFINRFKQQLRLQRIESLLKYRGVSK